MMDRVVEGVQGCDQECREVCLSVGGLEGVTAGERVRDHVVDSWPVAYGEVVALQFCEPSVVLAVGAARSTAAHEELQRLVVRVEVEVVSVQVVAESFARPYNCKAFCLRSAVSSFDVRERPAGISNCSRIAFVIVLGEDSAECGAAGVSV